MLRSGAITRSRWATALLALTLLAGGAVLTAQEQVVPADASVKAALMFNFAKFTDWPGMADNAPINHCVVGDEGVASALVQVVRGQTIDAHPIVVSRPFEASAWGTCQLLFVASSELRRWSASLAAIRRMPVLTVSDGKGFAQSGGVMEFYVESGHMHFIANVDAAALAGVHMSSRLLSLAKVIHD